MSSWFFNVSTVYSVAGATGCIFCAWGVRHANEIRFVVAVVVDVCAAIALHRRRHTALTVRVGKLSTLKYCARD